MDDALSKLEERLEGLMPKGISDPGRERLEETIEGLAQSAAAGESGGGGWKWGIGLAACLGVLAGAQFLRNPGEGANPLAGTDDHIMNAAVVEPVSMADPGPWVETVAMSRHVGGTIDEGWARSEDSPHLYRYWGYEVTDQEEILDTETGYVVTVYSQREERVPVRVTSL